VYDFIETLLMVCVAAQGIPEILTSFLALRKGRSVVASQFFVLDQKSTLAKTSAVYTARA
jgi:hypothetical protein